LPPRGGFAAAFAFPFPVVLFFMSRKYRDATGGKASTITL